MARTKKITVRLTEEQFEEIEKRRGALSRSEYLYYLLLDHLGKKQELDRELQNLLHRCISKCKEYEGIYAQLGKIGSNINQIARHLNSGRRTKKEKETYLQLALRTIELVEELKERLGKERNGSFKEN